MDCINDLDVEVNEIVSILPDLHGKDVLELGVTDGRFTGRIAGLAQSVTCVCYSSEKLEEIQKLNAGLNNIVYVTACVCDVKKIEGHFDFVFTNGLFMHMTDEDVKQFLEEVLSLLRPDGNVFFSENCFSRPSDVEESNAIFYRNPHVYSSLIESVAIQTDDKKACYVYETVISKSIQAYVKLSSDRHQIYWLLKKVQSSEIDFHGYKTFQEFLNKNQYTRTGILRYERIFGKDFISTGGFETTEEFVGMLGLKPEEHVLDVGAGIGGGAFYMAKHFNVRVTGIDLSSNVINIALERANERKIPQTQIQFELCDATKRNYPSSAYDVVYSRDTILYIADKRSLFASFLKWLKPGGRLLISDYCCSNAESSINFVEYVKQRGYKLLSPEEYGKLLEEVGFVNVRVENRTNLFVKMLKKELERIEDGKEDFLKDFSKADYDDLVVGWKDKIRRCADGEQIWGLFYAEKP